MNALTQNMAWLQLGEQLKKYQDFTPYPLALILVIYAQATAATAAIGILVLTFGELLRIFSKAHQEKHNGNNPNNGIITSGTYALVKNPIYLGNFLIFFGLAIYSGDLAVVTIFGSLYAANYLLIINYEEGLTAGAIDPCYKLYLDKTPAFIPKRLPNLDDFSTNLYIKKSVESEQGYFLLLGFMIMLLTVAS